MKTTERRSFSSVSNVEFEHVFFCLEILQISPLLFPIWKLREIQQFFTVIVLLNTFTLCPIFFNFRIISFGILVSENTVSGISCEWMRGCCTASFMFIPNQRLFINTWMQKPKKKILVETAIFSSSEKY